MTKQKNQKTNAPPTIVKQKGHTEHYEGLKENASSYFACRNVRLDEGGIGTHQQEGHNGSDKSYQRQEEYLIQQYFCPDCP